MERSISVPPGGEQALRRALLQRIADRFAFARALENGANPCTLYPTPEWECCLVQFEWPTRPPYRYPLHSFVHRICGEDCPHWHHQTEIVLA